MSEAFRRLQLYQDQDKEDEAEEEDVKFEHELRKLISDLKKIKGQVESNTTEIETMKKVK